MSQSLIQRASSLCLAAVLTLAMLGGINGLSAPADGAPQWAQNTALRA